MPSQNETLLRILTMLRHIPKHPCQTTARELITRLETANFKVSKRTVERDLLSLSAIFPLISNERSRPYGWSWSKEASPQFEEVKELVIKARNYANDLSSEDAKAFAESDFCFSNGLVEETRKAIYDMPITRDCYLHFKNNKCGFGKISLINLMADKLLMEDKMVDAVYLYQSADELIVAGWVID